MKDRTWFWKDSSSRCGRDGSCLCLPLVHVHGRAHARCSWRSSRSVHISGLLAARERSSGVAVYSQRAGARGRGEPWTTKRAYILCLLHIVAGRRRAGGRGYSSMRVRLGLFTSSPSWRWEGGLLEFCVKRAKMTLKLGRFSGQSSFPPNAKQPAPAVLYCTRGLDSPDAANAVTHCFDEHSKPS